MKLFEFLSEAISSRNIYTVRSEDSLPSIASSNDTTVDGIMWQNPQFASPSDIQPGSRIRLPRARMPTTSSASSGKPTTSSASSGKPTTSSAGSMKTANPVASELSKEQMALLNMIAARESGGDYNIINYKARKLIDAGRLNTSGGPGEHPFARGYKVDGQDVPGKEKFTAAGRYQMVWTTWRQAAALAGVDPKDFSPANQDRAALALAQQSYKNKFGSDLNTALTDPSKVSQVIAGLTPWSVQAGGPGFTPQNYVAALSAAKMA